MECNHKVPKETACITCARLKKILLDNGYSLDEVYAVESNDDGDLRVYFKDKETS